MSKTNDTPKLGDTKLVLADNELAVVTGGRISTKHAAKVELGDIKITLES